EVFVKGTDLDAGSIRIAGTYQLRKRFDPVDLPKLRQLGEEQPIAAADIENALPTPCRLQTPQHIDNQTRSGAPPPVLFKQVAISFAVLGIHRRRWLGLDL